MTLIAALIHEAMRVDRIMLRLYLGHMNQEQTTQEILAIVQFLKDNMASKADLEDLVTKTDLESHLTEVKSGIMNHVDSFVVLHQKLDTELVALRGKYDRLADQLQQIAKHLQMNLR